MTFRSFFAGRTLALTLVAAAGTVALAPRPAVAQAAAPTRIAVVNTQRVFNEMQEFKAVNAKMVEDGKKLNALGTEKSAALQKMKVDRDNSFKPGTPQHEDATKALSKAVAEFRVWQETEKANTEFNYKKQAKQMFDKIQAAVAEVAKKEGYDMVIADTGGDKVIEDLDQVSLQGLKAALLQKTVLFASEKNDLTSMVILTLDAKFKSAGGK